MDYVGPIDVVATLLFGAALVCALRTRSPLIDRTSKIFLSLSLGVYFLVVFFNSLEHVGITSQLDHYEDYLEIVFVTFFLVFAYSVHINVDLRKRNEAEVMLRAREEQYRTLVEAIPYGIQETDLKGTITFSNSANARLYGYSLEDLVGTSVYDLKESEEEAEKLREYLAFQVKEEPAPLPYYSRDRTRSGVPREVRVDWDYRRDDRGGVVGFISLISDITERRRMEEEVLKAQKLESLGVLAGGLAHDFNNLLTAILGNISVAKIYAGRETRVSGRLEEAEKASLRARDLTQQLITFSRGGEPVKKVIAVERVLREAAAIALSGSSVRSRIGVNGEVWPVEADEGQISQALSNLLLNAAQAMPRGGTVAIECGNEERKEEPGPAGGAGTFVKIVVRDEGVGIPREQLRYIFDPYYSTKQKGSGLGLSTAYSIVKKHGGEILVESRPGEGSVFTVFLPASPRERVDELPEELEPVRGEGRILVMDDERQVREAGSRMLAELGYEVDTAEEGGRALEMYREALDEGVPYAGVILDLTVPGGLGGVETVRRLTAIDPGVRAIVSSGYSDDPVMAEHERYGFAGVIVKPYTVGELGSALRQALTSPHQP
jgi:two-component system cell cycle sensor histidine kinase/response regulator CckA